MIKILIPTTIERRPRVDNLISFIRKNSDHPYMIQIYENLLGGWVPAMIEMLKHCHPDELVCVLGDDCEPRENWLDILVKAHMNNFPDGDGLVQPNDLTRNGDIASYPVATAGYLLKWIYPGYTHNFCDDELACVAKKRGKYIYVPESIVDHRHHSNTAGVIKDSTYHLEDQSADKDKVLFMSRKEISNEFNNLEALYEN